MTSLSTVITENKEQINLYLKNKGIKKNSTTTSWPEPPSYSDFQKIVIELLDLSNKSLAFTNFENFTEEEQSILKNKVLTLLALSLNFSDLMNYDFEKWLKDAS